MSIPVKHWLMWAFVIGGCGHLLGFQMADSSPEEKPAPEKFIFYWGSAQAALTAANDYRATLTLAPPVFRQMFFQSPRLWNGYSMEERVSFRLEGIPVLVLRHGQAYEALIPELYARVAAQAAPGMRFALTDLALTPQLSGAIDFVLEEQPASPFRDELLFSDQRYADNSWIDQRMVANVLWGRESDDVMRRDFFSPQEALQILQQQPAIVWQPGIPLQPVYAEVQIAWASDARHSFRVLLDDPDAYQQLVRYAKQYQFLIEPGTRLTLSLYSDRYDRLFEHTMRLVGADDPRLALRRHRDGHRVRLQWGPLEHIWEHRYLIRMTDSNGHALSADPMFTVRYPLGRPHLPELLSTRPTLWIDEERVPDLSFFISLGRQTLRITPEDALPDWGALPEDTLLFLLLHDLSAEGYDLSALALGVQTFPVKAPPLPAKALESRAPVALSLYLPVVSDEALEITFDIPQSAPVVLILQDAQGNTAHRVEGVYATGRHTLSVPRRLLPPHGRVLLETPYAKAQQSFEIR